MYICPKCKNRSEVPVKYCSNCGEHMIEQIQPSNVQYDAGQQQYQQYGQQQQYGYNDQYRLYDQYQPYDQYRQYPPARKPGLAKAIVGMIMSISGFSNGIVGALIMFIFALIPYVDAEFATMSIIYGVVFFVYAFVFSLIGLILSSKSRNDGCTSRMTSVGKVLGIIGLVLAGVIVFLTFGDCISFIDYM